MTLKGEGAMHENSWGEPSRLMEEHMKFPEVSELGMIQAQG